MNELDRQKILDYERDNAASIKETQDLCDFINKYASILDVLRKYGSVVKKNGSLWETDCPFLCDKINQMKVNSNKNCFYCPICKRSGDVISIVQEMEKCTGKEAMRKIKSFYE